MEKCAVCGKELGSNHECETCKKHLAAKAAKDNGPDLVALLKETNATIAGIKAENVKLATDIQALKAVNPDTGFVAPITGNVPPTTPRDPASEEKDGKIDPCAFMRIVVFGGALGAERAAFMNCDKGTQLYKDAAYTFERTMHETIHKDASMGTATAGGYVVPEEWRTQLIDLLRAKLVTVQAGAEVMEGLNASVIRIPRLSAGGTAYWVAENAAITASQQTYEQVTMTPHEGAALTKASNQLIQLSNPSAQAIITNDLVAKLKRLFDLAVMRGSGAGSEPTGIANASGIQTVAHGVNGATPSWDKLEEFRYKMDLANSLMQKLAWIMHPIGLSAIRQIKDSQGRPLFMPNDAPLTVPGAGTIFGIPVFTTTQLPINLTKGSSTDCYEIFLVDMAEVLVGFWGAMEVMATGTTTDAFTKNQTWIRVLQLMDTALRHPAAAVYSADARP